MEFRILGALEVWRDGARLALGGPKPRALLAILLLQRNRIVAADRLVDLLWSDESPETAMHSLQVHISQLRKVLSAHVLETRPPGYILHAGDDEVDASQFESLIGAARSLRQAGNMEGAARALDEVLALWRGQPLADVASAPFAIAAVARLNELRLQALEERLDAQLALGRHHDIMGELQALVTEYPLRERLRAQLMLALYRSGRQAEASAVYHDGRSVLLDQLGMEPGPEVESRFKAILRQDPALAWVAPASATKDTVPIGTPPPPAPPESPLQRSADERKVVTVLFAELDATARSAEPEMLRDMVTRYVNRLREIAEAHGGSFQILPAGTAMVVFGVPRLHADDAERAVRSALAMQQAAADLGHAMGVDATVRIGISSGPGITGDTAGQIVTGDVVNVAARLQQAAAPGEILVGPLTKRLATSGIEFKERTEGVARGTSETIAAFNPMPLAKGLGSRSPELGKQVAFVGRQRELRLLLDTFGRIREERRSHRFTVLGPAGVGKSRLVQEALGQIQPNQSVRVLRGRCLPYGTQITYWPVMEMLQQELGISLDDTRDVISSKLDRRLTTIVTPPAELRAMRNRLSVLLGLALPSDAMADVPASRVDSELSWAMRRYLEAVARDDPMVLVVDDLQWSAPETMSLLQQAAVRMADRPVFLLCIARPELLERYPGWGVGSTDVTTLTLNPLSAADTSTLITNLLQTDQLPVQLADKLIEQSGGNPLFCEEFLRALLDQRQLVPGPDGGTALGQTVDLRVPETIQAVLAARLDALPESERGVLQAASIVGERFTLAQVNALTGKPDLDDVVEGLRLKDLVQESLHRSGDSELNFKHVLVRDVAYESLPKDRRADLHERFEHQLESDLGDRQNEVVDVIAHHAERAYALSHELKLRGERFRIRGERALKWSVVRAKRALARDDARVLAASLSTAESAAAYVTLDDSVQLELQLLKAEQLRLAAEFAEALATASAAAVAATDRRNLQAAGTAHLCAARIAVRLRNSPLVREHAREAARCFEAARDPLGQLDAEWIIAEQRFADGEKLPAIRQVMSLARTAIDKEAPFKAFQMLSMASYMSCYFGFGELAEECLVEAAGLAEWLGVVWQYWFDLARAMRAWFRGDEASAEENLRRTAHLANETGDVWASIGLRRGLAWILLNRRRYEEADVLLEQAINDSQGSGDRWHLSPMLGMRALIAAYRRHLAAAERFAEEALAIPATAASFSGSSGTPSYVLGHVALESGKEQQALETFQQILQRLDAEGFRMANIVPAIGIARFLAERGQSGQAASLLDEAESWMERAHCVVWLEDVRQARQLIKPVKDPETTRV